MTEYRTAQTTRPAPPQAEGDRRLALNLENRLSALASAQAALRVFLKRHGVLERATYAAQLMMEEAVTNIVRYAFEDQHAHTIAVEVLILPDAIRLTFEDDGKPFDPSTAPEPARPASLDDAVPGGFGIHLMRRMAKSLAYRRDAGRNHLEVSVALS